MDNKANNYDIPKRDGSVWPEDICPAYNRPAPIRIPDTPPKVTCFQATPSFFFSGCPFAVGRFSKIVVSFISLLF